MWDQVRWALVKKRDHFAEFVANYSSRCQWSWMCTPMIDQFGWLLDASCGTKLPYTDICDLFSIISAWVAESVWSSWSMIQTQSFILSLHCSWISAISYVELLATEAAVSPSDWSPPFPANSQSQLNQLSSGIIFSVTHSGCLTYIRQRSTVQKSLS